jgi:ribosomal RNA-processing protein 12
LLASLTLLLPSTSLHVIVALVPETVLGTKEPSEKARMAAFEVIVSMGEKMSLGGVVKMSSVEGMEDEANDGISLKSLW